MVAAESMQQKVGGAGKIHEKNSYPWMESLVWNNISPMHGLNGKFGILLKLVTSAQAFSIVFNRLQPVQWDGGHAAWVSNLTDGLLLQSQLYGNHSALYAVLALMALLVGLLYLVELFRNSSQREWNGLLLRTANVILNFLMVPAFLPVMSLLGSHLSCHNLDKGALVPTAENCWAAGNVAAPIMALVAFLALLVCVSFYAVFFVETIAFDTVPLSAAHGRLEAAEAVVHGTLIFLTTSLSGQMQQSLSPALAVDILSLISLSAIAGLYAFYAPYYSRTWQTYKTAVAFVLAWAAISRVCLGFMQASSFEAAVFLNFGALTMVILSVWFTFYRRRKLMRRPVDKLRNPYEVELKARYMMLQKSFFWTRQTAVLSGTKPERIDDLYYTINQLYTQALKRFPESSYLYLCYANFLIGKYNFNYCLTVFSKARRSTQMPMDVAYAAFKRSRLIEKIFANQKGSVEVKNYFRFLDLSRRTESLQKTYIAKKLNFLAEIRKSAPNTKRLQAVARSVYETLNEIQDDYKQLFAINPSSKILRRYASFLSNMVNHPTMTKQVVDLADKMDAEADTSESKVRTQSLELQSALFDDRNAVFVMSGEEARLGEILEVSIGAIDMFGFAFGSEMVGANMNTMMPSPFSEMHMGFLRKYLETGFTSVLDQTRTVVAMNKLGYIFEVKLYVRQIIDSRGCINLVGVMGKTDTKADHIIIDNNHQVCAISSNLATIFGVTHDDDMSSDVLLQRLRQIHISKWLPGWDSDRASYEKEHGHTVTHGRHQLHVKVQSLMAMIKSPFALIEVFMEQRNRLTNSTGHSHESFNAGVGISVSHAEVSDENKTALFEKLKKSESKCASNQQIVKSAALDTGSNYSRSLFGGVTADQDFTDEMDALMRNTAMHSVPKFNEIMVNYNCRLAHHSAANTSRLHFWFKLLCGVFLLWLVIGNIIVNGIFNDLSLMVENIGADGVRNFESLRIRNAVRTMQLSRGCNPSLNLTSCDVVKNNAFTAYSPADARLQLTMAAKDFRDASTLLLRDVGKRKDDPEFYDSIVGLFFERNVSVTRLRGLVNENATTISLTEGLEKLGMMAEFLIKYPIASRFAGTLDENGGTGDVNGTAGESLFANSIPIMPRAVYFILKNAHTFQLLLDQTNTAYGRIYSAKIDAAYKELLVLSIVPVVFLMLGLAMYLLPNLRSLVNWELDIMNTLLSVPRGLYNWWYTTLIRKLEEDAKEEEEGVTAELYGYLQHNIPDGKTAADDTQTSLKNSPSRTSTKVAGNVHNKQAVSVKLSFREAMAAMNQTGAVQGLLFFSCLLAIIPLFSLAVVPSLKKSASVAYQMEWTTQLLVHMQDAHFNLREAAIGRLSHPDITDQVKIDLEHALYEMEELKKEHRYLVYGDPEIGAEGLRADPFFDTILYENACGAVKNEYHERMVLLESCESFERGMLTYGANSVLITLEKNAMNLIQQLNATAQTVSAQDAAKTVRLSEKLMGHLSAVILSSRPYISNVIHDATALTSYVLQPIQLIAAFFCAIWLYIRIYLPLVKALEQDIQSMHSTLELFGASLEQPTDSAEGDGKMGIGEGASKRTLSPEEPTNELTKPAIVVRQSPSQTFLTATPVAQNNGSLAQIVGSKLSI